MLSLLRDQLVFRDSMDNPNTPYDISQIYTRKRLPASADLMGWNGQLPILYFGRGSTGTYFHRLTSFPAGRCSPAS
jgi:hypothetical protein